MTIYIDLIFFENIIMNSIIIYATSLIVKSKVKIIRLILSATIGAIYSIALYITNMKIYTSIFSKFVLSIVMMYVAFKPQKVKKLCKQTIIFYLTSFIFGGVALYLVYYLKPEEILIKNGMYVGEYVLKVIILGAIFACIIVKISINLIKSKIKCSYCKITMIDTGNLVKEPITNAPVVIVESSLLEGIIPREILKNLDNILCGNLSNISQELQDIYISKLRCIPFSSLGKENGMLVGIKASEIIVENEDEIKVNKNIVLGIYDKSLTKKGEYRALIGTELA